MDDILTRENNGGYNGDSVVITNDYNDYLDSVTITVSSEYLTVFLYQSITNSLKN